MRALKYLGLDEEESSVSIGVRKFCYFLVDFFKVKFEDFYELCVVFF